MKFWWSKRLRRKPKTDEPRRFNLVASSDDMDEQERAEMQDVLNAAMNGPAEGVMFERGEDGVLRQRKV